MIFEYMKLSKQIQTLVKKIDNLADYLQSALSYLDSDPQSSLTKCRIVLEKILNRIYFYEMGKEHNKGMIGRILSDKDFSSKVPSRIRARMNFIREITNSGTHGEDVFEEDAIRVLQEIIFIVEWYVTNYDLYSLNCFQNSQSEDILSQLKKLYSDYLCPEITSVKFLQTENRCYLEITSSEKIGDYLQNETIKRTDLSFIMNDENTLFFDPKDLLSENIIKFLNDFDEISIINCTDLFTEESSTMIYDYWSKNGVCPP